MKGGVATLCYHISPWRITLVICALFAHRSLCQAGRGLDIRYSFVFVINTTRGERLDKQDRLMGYSLFLRSLSYTLWWACPIRSELPYNNDTCNILSSLSLRLYLVYEVYRLRIN
jgi:hypothetical protein